jgi:hypothetical protein
MRPTEQWSALFSRIQEMMAARAIAFPGCWFQEHFLARSEDG